MRAIKYIIIAAALACFCACKKETPEPANPVKEVSFECYNEADTIRVTVNGKTYFANAARFYYKAGQQLIINYAPGRAAGKQQYNGLGVVVDGVVVKKFDCFCNTVNYTLLL